MITIQIEGLEKLKKITDPVRFGRAADRAIDRAAETLRDRTKVMPPVSAARTGFGAKGIPVDTGRMRQAIQKKKTALLAAEVGAYVNYSRHVHDGIGKMPERPFFLWQLNDFGGRQAIEKIVTDTLSRLFDGQ